MIRAASLFSKYVVSLEAALVALGPRLDSAIRAAANRQ
jgi:hypothetical protein